MSRDITIVLKAVDQYSQTLDSFNQKVGAIGSSTSQLEGATKQTSSALNGMATAVTGAIVAFGTQKLAAIVGDMLDLGSNVNKTSSAFDALTRNIGGSQANMAELRSATGGVVDNLTLMNGANKLLQMGLASNSDELSKLSGMAVKLGSSMGMDATKAMSDFSLMLANNSIMRLDQFGISSGRVRARIIELQEATEGLSRSDAFKMAVMEEGADALERLGSAADAASTPIARAAVDLKNLAQSFSSNFTTGANGVLGIIQIATGNYPGQADMKQQAQDMAKSNALAFSENYYPMFQEYLSMAGVEDMTSGPFKDQLMQNTKAALELDPNMDVKKFIADQLAAGWANGEKIDPRFTDGYIESLVTTIDMANAEVANQAANSQQELKRKLYADFLAGDTGREFDPGVDYMGGLLDSFNAQPDDRQNSLGQQRGMMGLAAQRDSAFGGLNSAMTGAFGATGNNTEYMDPTLFGAKLDPEYMKSFVPQYMTQGGADQVTKDLQSAQAEFEKLQALADEKLITDQQLDNARNMVDNLKVMADQSQVAADNFKNMTLGGALGQTSGGMQGEMTDLIMKNMKDSGATDAQIAAMQAELDKTSGRETASSEELKSKVVPMIAKMSAEQAAKAMVNLDAMFKEAALQGLSQEQIAGMMPDIAAKAANGIDMSKNMPQYIGMMTGQNDMVGGQGGAGSIHDDEKSMNTRGKKGGTNPISDMSKSADELKNSTATIDKNMSAVATSTGLASKAADKLKDAIDGIASVKKITFAFDASDPSGILGLIKQLMGGTGLGDIVRANGGSVPGATGSGRTASATAD